MNSAKQFVPGLWRGFCILVLRNWTVMTGFSGEAIFLSASLEIHKVDSFTLRGWLEHEIWEDSLFSVSRDDYIYLNSLHYVRVVATTSLPSPPVVT